MVSPAASLPQSDVQIPEPRRGRAQADSSQDLNVGQIERVASVLIGSLLVARGVTRFSLAGLGVAGLGAAMVYRGSTGRCPMYKAMGVTSTEEESKLTSHPLHQHIRVEQSMHVSKPVEEVYRYWRNFENLPTFMEHLESVKKVDEKRSHWVARAPRGKTVEWNADIVTEDENRKIAWKSIEGADVPNAGQVLFEPDKEGTRVKVLLAYEPPAGVLGMLVAKMFGKEPNQTVREDLRRFKQIMETGEVATIDGQPQGECG